MIDLFPYSMAFVFSNETYTRQGQLVSLFEDPITGECSNFGISLRWFRGIKPQATAADIKALTQEGATHLYWTYFWEPKNLVAITLPRIAAKVLDGEVNMGATQGVRLLQKALGVDPDGILGPMTAARCNAASETILYGEYCDQAKSRYREIHDHQITQYGQATADKNLSEWLERLAKTPPEITRISTL